MDEDEMFNAEDQLIEIEQTETACEGVINSELGQISIDLSDLIFAAEVETEAQPEVEPQVVEPEVTERDNWFKKVVEKEEIAYKKSIDASSATEAKSRILSWRFDAELDLFVISRFDGIQYFERNIDKFKTLRESDLKELARLDLINPDNVKFADFVEKVIKRSVESKTFEGLKPAEGVYKKIKRKNPVSGRNYWKCVFSPVDCLKKIPLKKMPQDVLADLHYWGIDGATGEAYMVKVNDEVEEGFTELMRVYDYMHLINLSKGDLLKLHKNRIVFIERYRSVAKRFQNIVDLCVKKGLHAGSDWYK